MPTRRFYRVGCFTSLISKPGPDMESVLGIGGIFFKARDPKALAAWYQENLGITLESGQTSSMLMSTEAGEMTVWSTFPDDTKYFGCPSPFMLNYRVRDLDAMLAQLRAAGAKVDDRVEDYDYGRFGWATDPEGNRFELWQPPTAG
jgi:predicted enzyme related to lactoylglutathione lyase